MTIPFSVQALNSMSSVNSPLPKSQQSELHFHTIGKTFHAHSRNKDRSLVRFHGSATTLNSSIFDFLAIMNRL